MMELLTGNAIFTIICAFAIISSVNSQCCDFEATMCSWNLGPWAQSSVSLTPDLTSYPNFKTTQPSEAYLFLQDKQGTMLSVTPFTISAEGTLISMDYFFSAPSPDDKDYFQVYFANTNTGFSVLLTSMSVQESSWRHVDLQCNSTNSYCCGSSTAIPCQGTFQISAYVDAAKPQALFAIDNIGLCGPATTTASTTGGSTTAAPTGDTTGTGTTAAGTTTTTGTTAAVTTASTGTEGTTTPAGPTTPTTPAGPTTPTIPTLPPPNPSDCCQFETDICGITSSDWYWSSQDEPDSSVPTHSGEYFWTNTTDAYFASSTLSGVTPDTVFSINYYIDADVTATIYFIIDLQTDFVLVVLNKTGNAFESYTATCGACCGGGTCDGHAVLKVESAPGLTDPFIVAVDNIERDAACHASMPCCYFDDVYMCGFNNSVSGLYEWKFDGSSPPFTTVPRPGSNFVYLELYNYFGPEDVAVVLATHDMVVDNTVIFSASLYVSFQLTAENGEMQVNFVNAATGKSVQLDYVTDTSSTWKQFDFPCDSPHGSCCPSTDRCTGHVEIVAAAPGTLGGGTAVYGIDAFEIKDKCSVFPGHIAKKQNSKRTIKFQQGFV